VNASKSEPHVVSGPATAEEIEASDNAVIREAFSEARRRNEGLAVEHIDNAIRLLAEARNDALHGGYGHALETVRAAKHFARLAESALRRAEAGPRGRVHP